MSKNLIIGGMGQDGRLLSELLISKGEPVLCVIKNNSQSARIPNVDYRLIEGPKVESYLALLNEYAPDVVYNLASLSSVAACHSNPNSSLKLNYELVTVIFEAIRVYISKNPEKRIKFVQSGSSEMFGVSEAAINEESQMRPISVYGSHKKLAFDFLESQKRSYENLKICNLILFNHESVLRPSYFVTQKIAMSAAAQSFYSSNSIKFGNMDIARDWGCAREYVKAIAIVGSKFTDSNYVISSGQMVKVSQLLEHAMDYLGFKEIVLDDYQDMSLFRRNETLPLRGDSRKINADMGWIAERSIYSVIEEMVDFQLEKLRQTK